MKKSIILLLILCISNSFSQDLLDILDNESPKVDNTVSATFKGTRILNGHSIENRKKGVLEFLISHRFGSINTGIEELFGLDQSNIRFALEYSLTDDLMLGLGRSSFNKTYDGLLKYKLVKQKNKGFPLSVSVFESIAFRTLKDYDPKKPLSFNQKLGFTSQLLIASKINKNLSLQITPTYIHNNTVTSIKDPHDIYALGVGGRYKINKRVTFNAEYFHNFKPLQSLNTKNSFALGVDIETGGHVFQLILSNSITMIERDFITQTSGDFFSGDIHFGFNISRAFQVSNKKQLKE